MVNAKGRWARRSASRSGEGRRRDGYRLDQGAPKGSDKVYRFKVKDGVAIVKLPAFNRAGTKKLVVRYLGDDAVKRRQDGGEAEDQALT